MSDCLDCRKEIDALVAFMAALGAAEHCGRILSSRSDQKREARQASNAPFRGIPPLDIRLARVDQIAISALRSLLGTSWGAEPAEFRRALVDAYNHLVQYISQDRAHHKAACLRPRFQQLLHPSFVEKVHSQASSTFFIQASLFEIKDEYIVRDAERFHYHR